jgi:hypothetical protein
MHRKRLVQNGFKTQNMILTIRNNNRKEKISLLWNIKGAFFANIFLELKGYWQSLSFRELLQPVT